MDINIVLNVRQQSPHESMLLKMLTKNEGKKKKRHSELLRQLEKTNDSVDALPHTAHVGGSS